MQVGSEEEGTSTDGGSDTEEGEEEVAAKVAVASTSDAGAHVGVPPVDKEALERLMRTIVRMWAVQLLRDDARLSAHAASGASHKLKLTLAGKWAPRIGRSIDKASGLGKAIAQEVERLSASGYVPPPGRVSLDTEGEDEPLDQPTLDSLPLSLPSTVPPTAAPPGKLTAGTERMYRKLCSRLCASLDVVERRMAGGDWAGIIPSHVPSRANAKYKAALQNKQPQRGWRRTGKDKAQGRAGIDTWHQKGARGGVRSTLPDRVAGAAAVVAAALASVQEKTAKRIKGARMQAHELVREYMGSSSVHKGRLRHTPAATAPDPLLEAMWASLVASMRSEVPEASASSASSPAGGTAPAAKNVFGHSVALVDVSGSMNGLPMEVAIALGILVSSLQPEGSPWAGKCITFESQPKWYDIRGCTGLYETVKKMRAMPWGGSTDFNAALALLLSRLQESRLPPDLCPRTLYVFSDMQFNEAAGLQGRQHEQPKPGAVVADSRAAFRAAGYEPPLIVFWNLRASGAPTFHADSESEGVALVSGFSQAVMKQFCSSGAIGAANEEAMASSTTGEEEPRAGKVKAQPTPWEVLRAKLDSKRYDRVRAVLARQDVKTELTACASVR